MLEVLKYFLLLGCLGFGGPLATIASMQRDLVQKRKWISEDEFLRVFALIKAMPGPISFQMAIYLGQRRAGRLAGIIAAISFMLPSFLLMIALALGEKSLTHFALLTPLLRGFQAAAFALIAMSFRSLMNPYKKEFLYWTLCLGVAVFSWFLKIPEPIYILAAGLFALGLHLVAKNRVHELGTLFWICLKAGAIVFGTGLAIVPILEQDFVSRLHWVTHTQFLNALAFGQVTPGPVVISATYLGFITHGLTGALAATIGIFLPSAVHMLTWFPYFQKRFGKSLLLHQFARGAIAAVSGVLVVFCLRIFLEEDKISLVLSGLSLMALIILQVPAWALIPTIGALSVLSSIF